MRPSLGDLEVHVAPSPTKSNAPPSGSPKKQKSPKKRKTYYVSKKAGKLSSRSVSLTSVTSERDNGQGPYSECTSGHSTLDLSGQSIHKWATGDTEDNKAHKDIDLQQDHNVQPVTKDTDFDLQTDHKVKWRSFDIIEGVMSFETDFENTLNQLENESKQKRQRKAKKRLRRNKLRKQFTYTFLRPKHYKPLVEDPDAIDEIRAIEEEFERRRQEYVPLLKAKNKKTWKKLTKQADLQSRVQGVADSLAEMTVGPSRLSQPIRLKNKGRRRVVV